MGLLARLRDARADLNFPPRRISSRTVAPVARFVYYILMSEKRIVTFRLDATLVSDLDTYAQTHGWIGAQAGVRGGDHRGRDTGRSALLVHLVEALLEGRITVHPRAGVNPFPANEVKPGDTPDFPALICLRADDAPPGDDGSDHLPGDFGASA